jgi:hypothetical protein
MKTKVPTRRDSIRKRTLTNKVNCGLNKMHKSLTKKPKEKKDKRLNTYETKQRKMEEKIP